MQGLALSSHQSRPLSDERPFSSPSPVPAASEGAANFVRAALGVINSSSLSPIWSMIPSGYRFSEKIMLKQRSRAGWSFEEKSSRSRPMQPR